MTSAIYQPFQRRVTLYVHKSALSIMHDGICSVGQWMMIKLLKNYHWKKLRIKHWFSRPLTRLATPNYHKNRRMINFHLNFASFLANLTIPFLWKVVLVAILPFGYFFHCTGHFSICTLADSDLLYLKYWDSKYDHTLLHFFEKFMSEFEIIEFILDCIHIIRIPDFRACCIKVK